MIDVCQRDQTDNLRLVNNVYIKGQGSLISCTVTVETIQYSNICLKKKKKNLYIFVTCTV